VVAEQLVLCEDWLSGGTMTAARVRMNELRSSRYAPRTVEAYAMDWADFAGWCAAAGKTSLPADPETVALYLSHLMPTRKASTLARRVAAIASKHNAAGIPAPVTPAVRAVLSGARRAKHERVKQKAAITLDELRTISELLEGEETVRSTRDRAMILLGFGGAFRRSELAGLGLSDVQLRPDRVTVTLGRTKTDQEGAGRELVIPLAKRAMLCPVRALNAWVVERGRWPGPLFCKISRWGDRVVREPIVGDKVYYALRAAAERAGLDWRKFGAHSLRAGFVTASADAGADVWDIMATTGHKSVENLGRYVRRSVARYPLRAVL